MIGARAAVLAGLGAIVVEVIVVLARATTARRRGLLANALAGGLLMLAVLGALQGRDAMVLGCLALAGLAHAADLGARR